MARRVGKYELVGGWVGQRVRQGVRRQRHCFIEGRPLHHARGRSGGGGGAADEEEESISRQHLETRLRVLLCKDAGRGGAVR